MPALLARRPRVPGSLSVRNLDDALILSLKRRAARHGHSAEAEVREILRQALAQEAEAGFDDLAAELCSLTAGRTPDTRRDPAPGKPRREVSEYVVDASVAAKWVIDEPGTRQALKLRPHVLSAPDLLIAECANIVWKKVRLGELSEPEASLAIGLLVRRRYRTCSDTQARAACGGSGDPARSFRLRMYVSGAGRSGEAAIRDGGWPPAAQARRRAHRSASDHGD